MGRFAETANVERSLFLKLINIKIIFLNPCCLKNKTKERYIDKNEFHYIHIYIHIFTNISISTYKYIYMLRFKRKTEAQAIFLNLFIVAFCANGSLSFVRLFTKLSVCKRAKRSCPSMP
jgi:hypothetical protein